LNNGKESRAQLVKPKGNNKGCKDFVDISPIMLFLLYNIIHVYNLGNGNDDISSEERFEHSKIRSGSYL
jgi:hypothetical protein